MKRNKHSLSHYRLATFDMGELVPVACLEVLPGDAFRHSTSLLVRCSPLQSPPMHPVTVRTHSWFVPSRLLWDEWEEFITGGNDGEGDGASAFPTIDLSAGAAVGSLADYFGIPTGVDVGAVNALPFRAYGLIFNENYRDQDLVAARAISTAGGADATTATTVATIAWEKDYLSGARPWPQRGPEVTLPLGTEAPVAVDQVKGTGLAGEKLGIQYTDGVGTMIANQTELRAGPAGASAGYDLYADLSAATSVDVNTVRRAFALQRYQEARARYGARYVEYLRYLGVRPLDARLQRPEYLGGGKNTLAFSEVLQTAPTTDGAQTGVGDMLGHGISAMRTRPYVRHFEEHGYVITLCSVRPRALYLDGLHRMWSRATKEDFWQKELEHIGQQEIYAKEVYNPAADPDAVFGYADRYSEYRHHPSHVSGLFRSSLNDWHFGRAFGAEPSLNSAFVSCVPTKEPFQDQAGDTLWVMVQNNVAARRLVTRNAAGRIL